MTLKNGRKLLANARYCKAQIYKMLPQTVGWVLMSLLMKEFELLDGPCRVALCSRRFPGRRLGKLINSHKMEFGTPQGLAPE